MPNIKPVDLDGSTLEGGGQLVRVALSLSAITDIPVHIYNIRANRAPQGRSKPSGKARAHGGRSHDSNRGSSGKVEDGLKESHLAALIYLAKQCNAHVEGAELGSREVTFIPGFAAPRNKESKAAKEDAVADFETNTIELRNPGSVWLILQAILPYFIFGKLEHPTGMQQPRPASTTGPNNGNEVASGTDAIELTLKGGTNVSKSMSGEYVKHVLLPTLHHIGLPAIECVVKERGWAGNASRIGEVCVKISRSVGANFQLPPFDIKDRGDIQKVTVHIVAGDEDSRTKLGQGMKQAIAEHFGAELTVEVLEVEDSGDPRRLYVLVVARTKNGWRLGRDFLGSGRIPKNAAEREKSIEQACQSVVRELKSEVKKGGCVDEFLQDQLIVFQALASGVSTVDGGQLDEKRRKPEEECGDEQGSLHARTVRWVCEKMLRKQGVAFEPGGRCHGIGWNYPADHGAIEQLDGLSVH
ncbi:hypothetical protein PMZ80_000589 [Knufia obscura]|uniref:RNA 3'-terminal phosphate cyclase domain-containing protein n=1 Tax=Knufia obscura TaxID=1635080 RepID=A0ABR0S0V4_9EURO|nr:hypothetical protein PMZ80_000589 [Knufia obscura]